MGEPASSMEIPEMTSIEAFDAIIWPFFAVALVTTILRLYTRIFIVKGIGLDDGLILFGQVCDSWHSL